MKQAKKVVVTLAAALFALGAQAVPVSYDVTLTATGIGTVTPVFGISSLPAGPFFASFTLDEPLTPNGTFLPVSLTAFTATLGTSTWTLADVSFSFFSTDAAGSINPGSFQIAASHGVAVDLFEIALGVSSNVTWYAIDVAALPVCGFATTPPHVGPINGGCIGGGTGAVVVTERSAQIPEPATLLLSVLGLLGVASRRRNG